MKHFDIPNWERGEVSEGELVTSQVRLSVDYLAFEDRYEVFLIQNLSNEKGISYEAHVLDLPFQEGRVGGLLRRSGKGCYCLMERRGGEDNREYLAGLCRKAEEEDGVAYGLQPVNPSDMFEVDLL